MHSTIPDSGLDLKSLEAVGWTHLQKKEWDAALSVFQTVMVRDKLNEAAFQGSIAAYRGKRQFDKAHALLEKALQIHPAKLGMLSERAWLALDEKTYDAAIAAFDSILKHPKAEEGHHLWHVSLLRGQHRFEEAETAIQHAATCFPSSLRVRNEKGWLFFARRRYDEALATFDLVLSQVADNESALQGKVACLRLKGLCADAAALAKKSCERLPHSSGIQSEYGWLHLDEGDYEAAEIAFLKALDLAPDDPAARINYAWALVRHAHGKDLEEAATQCLQAAQADPTMPDAFGLLGVIAAKQNRLREAEAYFLHSIRTDALHGFHSDLGALYLQMGRYEEAKEHIQQAIRNSAEDGYARLQMGHYYFLSDDLKKALIEYRAASVLDPNNPEAHRALAICLMENNKLLEGERLLRKALKQIDERRRGPLHLALSNLLMRLGDETSDVQHYQDGLEQARHAIRLSPEDAAPYFHSGILRYKLDDFRGAVKDFHRCCKADSGQIEAELNAKRVRTRIRQERGRTWAGWILTGLLAVIILAQLVTLWILRVTTEKVSDPIISVLAPLLTGLLIVAFLLPWLTRLKMTGLEAELSEPKAKDGLATGPKGEIRSMNISPKS